MEIMAVFVLPLTIFAFLGGLAALFHGFSFITIEKHYHYHGKDNGGEV